MNKISVIIPTRNRSEYLCICLISLVRQSQLPFEVVIADSNSSDSTKHIVNLFKRKLNIKYVYVKKKGISLARNAALTHAKGDIFAFIDDDCIASYDWIEKIDKHKKLLKNHYIQGFSYNKNYKSAIANYIYFAVLADVLNTIKIEEKKFVVRNYLDTKNAIISRQQYEQVKPAFDEAFDHFHFGEDRDLGFRLCHLGYTGVVIMDIKVAHHFLTSLYLFIKKRFFTGRSVINNKRVLEKTIKKLFPLNAIFEKNFDQKTKNYTIKIEETKYYNTLKKILLMYTNKRKIGKFFLMFLFILDTIIINTGKNYQSLILFIQEKKYEFKK